MILVFKMPLPLHAIYPILKLFYNSEASPPLDLEGPRDMAVVREDVRKVAQLARLALSEDEEAQLVVDLNQMLDYVAALQALDTTDVVPTAHVLPIDNVFRMDQPGESLSQAEALSNAPASGQGHFRVPQVIE